MSSEEGHKQGKVRDSNSSAAHELPPLLAFRVVADNRQKTGDDENKMSETAQRHHHLIAALAGPHKAVAGSLPVSEESHWMVLVG